MHIDKQFTTYTSLFLSKPSHTTKQVISWERVGPPQ